MSTPWFAPEARVVLLNGASAAEKALLSARVERVKVEQVNTGCSKLDLTLNNQRHGTAGDVATPPYLFNDLQLLTFGDRLRVDMRYVGGASWTERGADPMSLAAGSGHAVTGWTPMILARVTAMQFAFPNSGVPKLTIQGEDLLSLLKIQPASDKTWADHEDAILASVVQTEGLTSALGTTGTAKRTATRFPNKLRRLHQRKGRTHLQFIAAMAKRMDYELFTEFEDPRTPAESVRLHFEPARSSHHDDTTTVDLAWGLNILSFEPRLEVWKQYTGCRATGRGFSGDDATADPAIVRTDLCEQTGTKTAIEVREALGQSEGVRSDNVHEIEVPRHIDKDRAKRKAEAELLRQSRTFLTAELETLGLPTLRPGRHVRVRGVEAPFDGLYYVTKASHSLDDSGYRTRLSLRRPGYTDPTPSTGGS